MQSDWLHRLEPHRQFRVGARLHVSVTDVTILFATRKGARHLIVQETQQF